MPIYFRRSNNAPITAPIVLVVGDVLTIKIEGERNSKNPSRRNHYILKPLAEAHAFKITHSAKDTQAEQSIRIEALKETSAEVKLYAHYNSGDMDAQAEGVQPISIRIVAKISLPAANTDAGLLTRLLLAEALSPSDKSKYGDGTDAIRSMELMREVLDNRITAIKGSAELARYAGFGSAATVRGVVYPGTRSEQFYGFANESISNGIQKNIQNMVNIANDGTDANAATYRRHIQAAIRIASQPHTTRAIDSTTLLFWRTTGRGSPVAHAVERQSVANQTFYSVSQSYLNNPKNPQ